MTEEEFRQKYPGSTDEQVRLYGEAVRAEALAPKLVVEPDIPMPKWLDYKPRITVPAPQAPSVATYPANKFFMRNFSLDDVPPEAPSASLAGELRDIVLGAYGLKSGLSPEQRQRLQTTDMTEDDILAMVAGAPTASEFVNLA